jgi:hypothetical protein
MALHFNRWFIRLAVLTAALATAFLSGGCIVGQLVGGMAASYERTGTHEVAAEYTGLTGKNFAVMVHAGREVQYEHPGMIDLVAELVATTLAERAGGAGWVPPATVRWYQTNNPRWIAMPYGDIAEALGVDRLVMVDIYEYRLHEPGNQYVWDGHAAARVGVVEADSVVPDEFMFESEVEVEFPREKGISPTDISRDQVVTGLNLKFAQATAWLFFDHEEPNYDG